MGTDYGVDLCKNDQLQSHLLLIGDEGLDTFFFFWLWGRGSLLG